MQAVVQRNNGTLVSVEGFEHEVSTGAERFTSVGLLTDSYSATMLFTELLRYQIW